MLSRTIEAVKVADKTLFYEIRIEDVEFHILGQTVKTNKWLRFEEWQQIYEQLNKSFSTYTTTPPDFTIKSFTVGNYIRVEIEPFPIENCYSDLFKVELENCLCDFLQVRIKQLTLGSSLEEIQETERKQEVLAAAMAKRGKREMLRKQKKKRKTSLSEYNPVTVRKNHRTKYVPPYKPSKLSPENNDPDEPYSPKPVNSGDTDCMEDYSPYTISTSDNNTSTQSIVPTYKPSTIVKNSPKTKESIRQDAKDSLFSRLTIKSEENIEDDSLTPCSTVESTAPTTPLKQSRSKRFISPKSNQSKRAKFSEDLFANSDDDDNDSNDTEKNELETYIPPRPLTRNKPEKELESETNEINPTESAVAKSKENIIKKPSSKKNVKLPVPERRSSRTPVKKIHEDFEMYDNRPTKDLHKLSLNSPPSGIKPEKSKLKDKKEIKMKKSSTHAKNKTVTSSQESEAGSSSQQDERLRSASMPTIEELRKNTAAYERQIEALEKMSNELKEHIKPPPEVDIIDLNDMSLRDLVATFDKFKPKLDKFFAKYKDQRRFHIKGESDKLHLLILNVIDRDRVMSMMEHLQSVYEPHCDGVPTYTDVFMNILTPEWVLRLFMATFNMSREDAIKRIKEQRDFQAYNQTMSLDQST